MFETAIVKDVETGESFGFLGFEGRKLIVFDEKGDLYLLDAERTVVRDSRLLSQLTQLNYINEKEKNENAERGSD